MTAGGKAGGRFWRAGDSEDRENRGEARRGEEEEREAVTEEKRREEL